MRFSFDIAATYEKYQMNLWKLGKEQNLHRKNQHDKSYSGLDNLT